MKRQIFTAGLFTLMRPVLPLGNNGISPAMFCNLHFITSPDVLAPYPQTETLVEKAIELNPSTILDIGTGSGNIIISMLKALPDATGVAVDISAKALAVAHRNALLHGVSDRITLALSDVFSGVTGTFDVITCNPPYWSAERADGFGRAFPRIAYTDGGHMERTVKSEAGRYLNPGGLLIMEDGCNMDALLLISKGQSDSRGAVKTPFCDTLTRFEPS